MPDRENLMDGLHCRATIFPEKDCAHCHYGIQMGRRWGCDFRRMTEDALALLKAQEPIEARLNLCESCAKEYAECEADKTDLVYGSSVGNDNIIGCPWYVNRWKAQEPSQDWISRERLKNELKYYIDEAGWTDEINKGLTWCLEFIDNQEAVKWE